MKRPFQIKPIIIENIKNVFGSVRKAIWVKPIIKQNFCKEIFSNGKIHNFSLAEEYNNSYWVLTTDDSALKVHEMASSSEVCDISNTHTRPSVEPVASVSGWLGWNLTCLDENTNVC